MLAAKSGDESDITLTINVPAKELRGHRSQASWRPSTTMESYAASRSGVLRCRVLCGRDRPNPTRCIPNA